MAKPAVIVYDNNTREDLDDLNDVVITAPADNQLLTYDNATSTWINQTPTEAGLDERFLLISNNLSDVSSASTARVNLGLGAGGAGDIWVEKAGDTMTGDLTAQDSDIVLSTVSVSETEPLRFNPSGFTNMRIYQRNGILNIGTSTGTTS